MRENSVIGLNAMRVRKHWTRGAKVALMFGVAVGLVACKGPSVPSTPKMTQEMVEKRSTSPAPADGWQSKAEGSFALMGMNVERFEWTEAAKGSYSRFAPPETGELERPDPSNKRGTLDVSLRVFQLEFSGWFGCGWAHLAEPFKGINGRVLQVAIPLIGDGRLNEAHLAVRASEICRYSAMSNPTQADGTLMSRPGYARPYDSAEEDVIIQSGGKWATSTRVGRDLIFFNVPEDGGVEEATKLFQMAVDNKAVGKPEDKFIIYRKSRSVVSQRFSY